MGFIALGLLLVAEILLGHWLRGLSVIELIASRDPVSGTGYYKSVGMRANTPNSMTHEKIRV